MKMSKEEALRKLRNSRRMSRKKVMISMTTNFKVGDIVAVTEKYKEYAKELNIPLVFTVYKIENCKGYQKVYYHNNRHTTEGYIANDKWLRIATKEDFYNKKIKVDTLEQSKMVQRLLFSYGFKWGCTKEAIVKDYNCDYISVDESDLWNGDDKDYSYSIVLFEDLFPEQKEISRGGIRMKMSKEEALRKIDELKKYVEKKEEVSWDIIDFTKDNDSINYKDNTLITLYDLLLINSDIVESRSIELAVLYKENLPDGYTFKIGKGFCEDTVLKIVKVE